MSTNTLPATQNSSPVVLTPRAKRWGAGLLVSGLLAAGAGLGQEAYRIHQENKLVNKLEQPAGQVHKELKLGEINPAAVVTVQAPESDVPYNVAVDIVGSNHDPREVSDIISSQAGTSNNQVIEGNTFVVPAGDVPADSPYITKGK